ncbi:MAG: hypothetical protein DHS20C11_24230 [Lysobacteraceae bacterium]|nr:MAG: hypothetical protein DHS20C11_24230 [Xanthomonadaceae bacterium]
MIKPGWFLLFILSGVNLAESANEHDVLVVGENWNVATHQRQLKVKQGADVFIDSQIGNVAIRPSSNRMMAIEVSAQSPVEGADNFRLLIDEADSGAITVRPVFEGGHSKPEAASLAHLQRADIGLRIPAGCKVHVVTSGGDIDVEDLTDRVSVQTVDGNVRLIAKGSYSIENSNGDSRITMKRVEGPSSLSTTHGTSTLYFPRDAAFRVAGASAGTVTTDFSIVIKKDRSTGLKRFEAVTDGEGPLLTLTSVRGNFSLRELQAKEELQR